MRFGRRQFVKGVLSGVGASALTPLAGLVGPDGARPLVATAQVPASLDPKQRVHLLLQVGAQLEPTKRVRVIVQTRGASVSRAAIAKAAQAPMLKDLPLINGLVLEIPQRAAAQLATTPGVRYVSLDHSVRLDSIDASALQTTHQGAIDVPGIWSHAALPATGQGVTVAVIDTGVNTNHPDFAHGNLTAVVVNKSSLGSNDQHGHGTHVVGTIKGRNSAGAYIGIAPNARVISVKVANDLGIAMESDLIDGLQWVFNNRLTHAIRVVNVSITSAFPSSYVTSPVAAAVEQLWLNGVTVVVSSGNQGGAGDATWYPPANDPFVISVGALDHAETVGALDDTLAEYSSRGLTQDGFDKPEILAPGRRIVAPLAGTSSTLALIFPDRIVLGPSGNPRYIRLSGTSMAAPVLTGVIALLLQRYPDLSPNQIKWLLRTTARNYPGQVGSAGVVDPLRLFSAVASGPIGVANQGLTPASDIDPVTNTISSITQANFTQAYWKQAYWNQAYWKQSVTWDAAGLD